MVQNNATTDNIEWNSEIEYDDSDGMYDRSASAKLVIDGPDGRLVVLKRYRSMVDGPNGLMESGRISEHSTYYRADEDEPFVHGKDDWSVPEEALADREAFVEDCRAAVEADPEVEYKQYSQEL